MSEEQYITEIMLNLGVPAHLRGYRYLREAVLMSAADMELVGSVTKLLYPEVAKKFKVTDQKVERGIRNAIEVSWERGNTELFDEIFVYNCGKIYTDYSAVLLLVNNVNYCLEE